MMHGQSRAFFAMRLALAVAWASFSVAVVGIVFDTDSLVATGIQALLAVMLLLALGGISTAYRAASK